MYNMKKIGIIICAALLIMSCNDSANDTTTTDSTTNSTNNTNNYDTGVGSSMADTSLRMDTPKNRDTLLHK